MLRTLSILASVAMLYQTLPLLAELGGLSPEHPPLTDALGQRVSPEPSGAAIILAKAGDGLFHLTGRANGRMISFIVDTGATTSVIDARAAVALGLMPPASGEDNRSGVAAVIAANAPAVARPEGTGGDAAGVMVKTAAGPVTMRRARIAELALAGQQWTDVPVIVTSIGPGQALLGADIIARLGTLRIADDQLEITPPRSARGAAL